MSRPRFRARRGSALILVLLMTLAVAALAVAAIFMASSANLLSRFYDRERDHRFAAEAAIEIVRSRLELDPSLGVPDTGMRVLASGLRIPDADGVQRSAISVDVYGAATGDSSGATTPHVTLIARAWDAAGTRHVRRVDLRRESFSQYQFVVDRFPNAITFGPGTFAGRVHSNDSWRSGGSSATASTFLGRVTTSGSFVGTATFNGDSASNVATLVYPADSTFRRLDTLAAAANLLFEPVSGSSGGNVRGSRLEFVAFDADGDGTIEVGEGFARVFDLAAGMDTSRLRVSLNPSTGFSRTFLGIPIGTTFYAKSWDDPIVQNQCGAFYLRNGRWQFFPVAVHRTAWARSIIVAPGGGNVPAVNNPAMNAMDAYDWASTERILGQSTARCFPAGSPYLMPTERMTNAAGVVTGTAADVYPWGSVAGSGGYGGLDTTFTPRSHYCLINTTEGTSNGRCVAGTLETVGEWRAFGGTAVSGIASSIRQAPELPYLWPLGTLRNAGYRGVMRASGGPLFVSGLHRGRLTLVVDGSATFVDRLEQVQDPADPATPACDDQLGIVATGDILVANSALFRARRIAYQPPAILGTVNPDSMTKFLGGVLEVVVHAQLMSLGGTVGIEDYAEAAVAGQTLSCPPEASGNSASGCFRLVGGAAMRDYTPLYSGSNAGMRWAGIPDRCQETNRRPPFFPLTNRYTEVRSVEIRNTLANNPVKIRAILMRLKGKTL